MMAFGSLGDPLGAFGSLAGEAGVGIGMRID
jgi:hypothetical protein